MLCKSDSLKVAMELEMGHSLGIHWDRQILLRSWDGKFCSQAKTVPERRKQEKGVILSSCLTTEIQIKDTV